MDVYQSVSVLHLKRDLPDMLYTSTTGQREETSEEPSENFRRHLQLPVVDHIISEMNRRFSDQSSAVMKSMSCVICPTSKTFLDFTYIQPLLSIYAEQCNIYPQLLQAEITVARNLITNELGEKLQYSSLEDVLTQLTP